MNHIDDFDGNGRYGPAMTFDQNNNQEDKADGEFESDDGEHSDSESAFFFSEMLCEE